MLVERERERPGAHSRHRGRNRLVAAGLVAIAVPEAVNRRGGVVGEGPHPVRRPWSERWRHGVAAKHESQ